MEVCKRTHTCISCIDDPVINGLDHSKKIRVSYNPANLTNLTDCLVSPETNQHLQHCSDKQDITTIATINNASSSSNICNIHTIQTVNGVTTVGYVWKRSVPNMIPANWLLVSETGSIDLVTALLTIFSFIDFILTTLLNICTLRRSLFHHVCQLNSYQCVWWFINEITINLHGKSNYSDHLCDVLVFKLLSEHKNKSIFIQNVFS